MTNEPRWDDERLDVAFHEAFDRPAPADLVQSTVTGLTSARTWRLQRWSSRWRPLTGVAAAGLVLVAATAVVIGLGALKGTAGTVTDGPPGFRTFHGSGISFDFPDSWTFRDASVAFSGGSTIGIVGTLPVDAGCGGGHVDINCYYQQKLTPGTISVVIGTGAYRGGTIFDDERIADGAERIVVAGLPALFTDRGDVPGNYYDADLQLDWAVAYPTNVTNVYRIEVAIRGPGVDEYRAQAEALVASFRFNEPGEPLPTGPDRLAAAEATVATYLTRAEADYDRGWGVRDGNGPSYYACFPAAPNTTKTLVIRHGPGGALGGPLEVTCSTEIHSEGDRFWRVDLSVSWAPGPAYPTGRYRETAWLTATGEIAGGRWDGDAMPDLTAATPTPPSNLNASFPRTVLGLPVISVSEAIRHRDTSLDSTELAVRGYYSLPGPMSCPAPAPEYWTPPIYPNCPAQFTWLLEVPEQLVITFQDGFEMRPPTGPGLNPITGPYPSGFEFDFENLRPFGYPVVMLGHFDDHRAGTCQEADVDLCRHQFVVDSAAWIDGRMTEIQAWRALDVPDGTGGSRTLTPKLDESAVRSRVASIGPGPVLSIGVAVGDILAQIEPSAGATAELTGTQIVWLIRVLDSAGPEPRARTLLVPDEGAQMFEIDSTGTLMRIAVGTGAIAWLPPWADPTNVPAAVSSRAPVPFCGVEGAPDEFYDGPDETVRACFVTAWGTNGPAEFATIRPTTEGDPIATIYRLEPGVGITVFRASTSLDAYGATGWLLQQCTDLTLEPAFGFTLDGCSDPVVLR